MQKVAGQTVSCIQIAFNSTRTLITITYYFLCEPHSSHHFFLCLPVAALPFLIIESGAVKPYRRGFYCSDESIKYPAKHRDTISDGVLSAVGMLVVILSVSLILCMAAHTFTLWDLFLFRLKLDWANILISFCFKCKSGLDQKQAAWKKN